MKSTGQEAQITEDLIVLFGCLSEALIQKDRSSLPEWMVLSGKDWPLFDVCSCLSNL
jgi:hypothetical protein